MSVKVESKAPSKTEQTPKDGLQTAASSTRELTLLESVIRAWKDFDTSPGEPVWKKRPMRVVETDPFGCSCGPCKRFWKENFTNISILKESVLSRAQKTSTMFRPDQDDWRIRVGDRVIIDGKQTGVVKFVGLLDENVIAPSVYVGVKCDEHIGSTHNGVMNGTRYFHCPRGHGALVPYTDVRRVNPPETRPPVSGNFMFDSYQEVVKQRALRRQKMVEEFEGKAEKPVRQSRLRSTYTAFDENDIAYKDEKKERLKDAQRQGETQVYHYANSTVKVRTGGPPKPKADPQARRFAKWKEEFGGGEKGERLVKTLKKLHEAFAKGRDLDNEPEQKPEEEEEDEMGEDGEASPPPGSKPPTRSGDRSTASPSKSRPRTPAH